MREKKKKTVECSMINLQREIICVAVGFQKVLTGCLFNMFNIFDVLHTEDFYKLPVKYNCFKLPLDSLNLILFPQPGCVCPLQNDVILGAVSMAKSWFMHHLRIAVGIADCGEPLTFFFLPKEVLFPS